MYLGANPIIAVTLIVTLLSWLVLSIGLRGEVVEMDPDVKYSFLLFFTIYRQIYAVIFLASIVLSMLMPSPESRLWMALATVYSLFFTLWLTFCYEGYQHRGKAAYTGWRYAVTLTLGGMSPILFVIGLLVGIVNGA